MYNIWLVVRDDAKQLINVCLSTAPGEYSGPVDDEARALFQTMADYSTVQKLFKSPDFSGNDYHLFSLYVENGDAVKVRDVIDTLTAKYPDHIIMGGAWLGETGEQVPGYPPHAELLKLMPNLPNPATNEFDITATVVTDVNLMAGQAPRDFS